MNATPRLAPLTAERADGDAHRRAAAAAVSVRPRALREMTPERAAARADAVRRELARGGVLDTLTPLAPHVFGVAREPAAAPAAAEEGATERGAHGEGE